MAGSCRPGELVDRGAAVRLEPDDVARRDEHRGVLLLTATLVLTSVVFDATKAFGDGILVGDPGATGTFRWAGLPYLQTEVTYAVAEGDHSFVGGAFTPLTWLLLLVGMVSVGRLWRALRPRSAR